MKHFILLLVVCLLVACTRDRRGGGTGTIAPSATLTSGDVCNVITPSYCDLAIRCGEWDGTRDDCVAATLADCCDDCNQRLASTRAEANACSSALLTVAQCDDTDP